MTAALPYDFHDWLLADDDPPALRPVIIKHLQTLYTSLREGKWTFDSYTEDAEDLPSDKCEAVWRWGPDLYEDDGFVRLGPAKFRDILIEHLRNEIDNYDPIYTKDSLRELLQRSTAGWRAALAAVEAEAAKLLDELPETEEEGARRYFEDNPDA